MRTFFNYPRLRSMLSRIMVAAGPLAALGALLPAPAQALLPMLLGGAAVGIIVVAILFILQYVGSALFAGASYLLGFFLEFNYHIFDGTPNLVTVGWGIVRDVANLGFVLLMVIIGIATIVRFKDYAAKTALRNLIAAAIIVNFSFAIAQVFVDFSHSLTRYFFEAVNGSNNVVDLVSSVSGAFNPQRLLAEPNTPNPVDPSEEESMLSSLGKATLTKIASLAFTVIFTFLAAAVLLVFAGMLLLRYLHLTFLIIISPIIWLFWAFPGLSSNYSKWWTAFIKWVFFAPVVSFFIYLALLSVRIMGSQTVFESNATSFFSTAFLMQIMQQGSHMIVLCGLMVGGIYVADKMGADGASGALALGKKGLGSAKKWVGGKTRGAVSYAGRRAATAGADEEGRTLLQRVGAKYGQRLSGVPVFGRAFSNLSTVSSKAQATMEKNVDAHAKSLDGEEKENLTARSNQTANKLNITQEELAALAIKTAEKGGWDGVTAPVKARMIKALRTTGSSDKILAYAPELATEFEGKKEVGTGTFTTNPATGRQTENKRLETDEERAKRVVTDRDKIVRAAVRSKVKEADKLTDAALADAVVLSALSSRHISQLADIEIEDKIHIKETLEGDNGGVGTSNMRQINEYRTKISDYLKKQDEAKAREDKQGVLDAIDFRKRYEANMKGLIDSLSDGQKEALRVRDTMADNAAYGDIYPKGSGKKK